MRQLLARIPRPLAAGLVGLLVLGAVLVLRPAEDTKTVSAQFSRAVSVFEGTQVRILGVPVGEVTAVIPQGSTVRVEMEYAAEHAVPADAQAVIITPTLTADRFVQLTPAYTEGPELQDGAEIEVQDTGTPVELDRIYRSLSDLTKALGPNGVNRNGTLNNTLEAGAKLLDGQGRRANRTIKDVSTMVQTLGDAGNDLFGTVRALDEFTAALADNDEAVSVFMRDLGQVSQQLAGEKQELRAALRNLASVLGKVEGFVKGNRELLVSDVEDLTRILVVLGDQKKSLENILDIGPAAMGNLAVAFNPRTGSIGSRISTQGNIADLDGLLCTLAQNGDVPQADQACEVFEALLEPVLGETTDSPPPDLPGGGGLPGTSVRYGDAAAADSLGQLLGGRA